MRHLLLMSTCLVALASGARAETVISTKQTTTVRTTTPQSQTCPARPSYSPRTPPPGYCAEPSRRRPDTPTQ